MNRLLSRGNRRCLTHSCSAFLLIEDIKEEEEIEEEEEEEEEEEGEEGEEMKNEKTPKKEREKKGGLWGSFFCRVNFKASPPPL
jgi:hypothetical protein